jgi:anti-sigma factor RsiW
MTCADIRELMTDVAGGELDGARADEVRAHAASCEACGRQLDELEATVGLLRRAGSEPLPEGFTLSLHQALVAAGAPERHLLDRVRAAIAMRPVSFAASAAALAAMLATGGTFALLHRPHATATTPTAAPVATAYSVPASKLALVKIDFVAAEDIDDVAFEITLPDGLRFVSGGNELAERTFRFQGKLAAGSNPIPIAVRGPRAGRYKVIAHAIGSALDVTQEVVLEVTS